MSEEKTQTSQTQADPFELGYRNVCQVNEKGQEVWVQVPLTQQDLLHPQEGDVMGQGRLHDQDCFYLRSVIEMAFDGREGILVLHDVLIDWDVKDLGHHSPDISVLAGFKPKQGSDDGGMLHIKRLGLTPLLVIEVTSPSTRNNDLVIKVEHYHRAGLPFYAIVDYRGKWEEREVYVLGYRWTPDGFVRLPLDEKGRLWLEPVKLWLAGEGNHVVLYDEQGQRMPGVLELARNEKQLAMRLEEEQSNAEEAILARREAIQKLEQEAKARKLAEAWATDEEKARQLAETRATDEEKARREEGKARRDAEARATDEEKARKNAEQKAADEEKARKLAEQKAADEEKARKLAEQKAADVTARLADLEARLRLLGESTGDPS